MPNRHKCKPMKYPNGRKDTAKNGDIQELAQRLEEATHIDWQQKSEEALKIARRFDISEIVGQWKLLIEKQ